MNDRPPDPDELLPRLVDRCLRAAAPLEFATFLVGIKAKRSWRRALSEEELLAWKRGLKSQAGLALHEAWPGRVCDFERPELLLVYDCESGRVERTIRSLYLYGRYRKLSRDLPQTRAPWRCPECRGKGCETCGGTGKRHPVALEDLLGAPLAEALQAADYQLHGMGREDIDVRCLGGGRPFVLELCAPKKRSADPDALARTVVERAQGQAELPAGLQWVGEEVVARVKGFEADKRYLAVCEAAAALAPEAVAALREQLEGCLLEQRTPQRVARRRSDRVRRRRVVAFVPSVLSPARFQAEVEAQSGTYIKELISGDGGRTQPSVAELLGVATTCVSLDVLDIRCRDLEILTPGT